MKPYQMLKTPVGMVLLTHFFIQDKGKPETRHECYVFRAIESVSHEGYLYSAHKGDIVTANAHVQDNYNEVSWGSDQGAYWRWFERVHLKEREKYEICFEP